LVPGAGCPIDRDLKAQWCCVAGGQVLPEAVKRKTMLKALLGVSRARFLLLPVVLVAVGSAASAWDGGFSRLRAVVALAGLVALHAAVNAFNEASDFRTGIDLETRRTPFSGGSGTLPSGRALPAVAVWVGVSGSAVGLIVGAWFLTVIGWRLLPILVLGGFATLAYSDLLARAYMGEIFAGLGLGSLPVLGSAMVMDGAIGPAAVAASVPAFLMTFNLLFLNEFPDETADRSGGRRNLVSLLGRARAARLYVAVALLVPAWIGGAVALGSLPTPTVAAIAPSVLLIDPVRWALRDPASDVPIPGLAANVAWNLATNGVLAITLFAAVHLGGR
jgi:1,4-dihydroxy-2-naphthoate octaprenyltransferase